MDKIAEIDAIKPSLIDKMFGNTYSILQDKSDQYVSLGHSLRIERKFEDAIVAYLRMIDIRKKMEIEDYHDVYIIISSCYEKLNDIDNAIKYYSYVAEYYKLNSLSMAAKYFKKIAELYELIGDIDNALSNYEKSASIYETNDNYIQAKTSLEPMIKILICTKGHQCTECNQGIDGLDGRLEKALEICKKIINHLSTTNVSITNVSSYHIKKYQQLIVLLKLAMDDSVGARMYYDSCNFDMYRSFQFLSKIIDCVDTQDIEEFSKSVHEMDSYQKLDDIWVNLLSIIKKSIIAEQDNDLC